MSTDSNNIPFPTQPGSGQAPEPDAHVEPASDATPQAAADELLAHGLLTYLHNDRPEMQSRRVDRVMGTITEELAGSAGAPAHRFRFPIRSTKGWLALAASIALVAAATFIGLPTEATAQAVVEQSIAAMRTAGAGGDRRYEVQLAVHGEDGTDVQLKPATVDMRAPNQLLLLATAPDGHQVIAGRDEKGDWCYRRDEDGGVVEREHPQRAWPRWSKVGDESLFADSVDRLLEEMTKGYNLTRESDAALAGGAGHSGKFHHILATRKRVRGPGADKVEIWIDPASNAVERIEMKWSDPPAARGHQAGGPPAGQDGGRVDWPDGAPPRGDRPRRPHPRPDGPMGGPDADDQNPGDGPRGGGGDRPPHPHPPRPDGPDGAPGAGPDSDQMDGPPQGDRPRRPHPQHPPRPDGPMGDRPGPGGPGPDGDGPRGGGDRPAGRGPAGAGQGAGERHMPPKLLVIQRVDAPKFADGWFSPEGHTGK